jgi:phage-related tail protein
MASAADIDAKNTELQSQAKIVEDLQAEVDALRAPYHAKLDELTTAINKLGELDDEMETLTKDYEPPTAPQP